MKNIILVPLALFLLSMLSPDIAQGSEMKARMDGKPYSQQFSQDTWGCGLNLTVEQTQKMRDIQENFLKETDPLRNELRAKENELRAVWDSRNPDQEKILRKQKEIKGLEAQIQAEVHRYREEARKFLTPEQLAQMGTFPRGYETYQLRYGMRGGLGRGRGMAMAYGFCPSL